MELLEGSLSCGGITVLRTCGERTSSFLEIIQNLCLETFLPLWNCDRPFPCSEGGEYCWEVLEKKKCSHDVSFWTAGSWQGIFFFLLRLWKIHLFILPIEQKIDLSLCEWMKSKCLKRWACCLEMKWTFSGAAFPPPSSSIISAQGGGSLSKMKHCVLDPSTY